MLGQLLLNKQESKARQCKVLSLSGASCPESPSAVQDKLISTYGERFQKWAVAVSANPGDYIVHSDDNPLTLTPGADCPRLSTAPLKKDEQPSEPARCLILENV